MTNTVQHKKRLPLVPVLIFLGAFVGLLTYGYLHFFRTKEEVKPANSGLNNRLPVADSSKPLSKLEMYLQAEKDSAAKKELRENDPYGHVSEDTPVAKAVIHAYKTGTGLRIEKASRSDNVVDEQTAIERKMAQIYQSLKEKHPETIPSPSFKKADTLTSLVEPKTASDPELNQLDGMLDKILQIQRPDLAKPRQVKKDSSSAVSIVKLGAQSSVTAVVHSTQVLSSGSTIKLRLTENMQLGTMQVPKGCFVYGVCNMNNERLNVQLTNLAYLNQVIPVSLSVYDIDGIEGIYIPGNIQREVMKDGADQAIGSFNLGSYDPSLTGHVASAGLQATKALLSRKVKQVRVTVKAGHRILLQNAHTY